jgi:ribokinase
VNSRVSGVGYNVAKALMTLGDAVRFLSLVGADAAGRLVADALQGDGIPAGRVLPRLPQTAQSAILYDPTGRRQIHVDLKDIQERVYPVELFDEASAGCALAVLCNINFSRPFLARARQLGIPIATDVHTIGDLADAYNRDFMAAAEILFMSDERLPCAPEAWIRELWNRYGMEIAVVGLGSQGALLGVRRDRFLERMPAVATRPIVNTIGAGDALFSAFVHFYARTRDPYDAIRRANVFASYKIGEASAAEGFLTEAKLDDLLRER